MEARAHPRGRRSTLPTRRALSTRLALTQSSDDVDRRVCGLVYDIALRRGTPPTLAATADGLGESPQQVAASFQRLAVGRVLVLAPDTGEILMANPFFSLPTPFLVEFEDYACYGNCIWDAMGVVAIRGRDARIKTSCGDCGAPMEVQIVSQAVRDMIEVLTSLCVRLYGCRGARSRATAAVKAVKSVTN